MVASSNYDTYEPVVHHNFSVPCSVPVAGEEEVCIRAGANPKCFVVAVGTKIWQHSCLILHLKLSLNLKVNSFM